MKRSSLSAIFILSFLLLAGVFLHTHGKLTLFAANPTVRLAEPDYLSFALIRIAHQKGYFRAHGVNVQLTEASSGRDALDLVLSGKADIAGAAGMPLAASVLEGQDVMVLAGLATVDGAHAIVAPRGQGIRSPFDLRGRTIGVSARTTSEYFLDRYLDMHGLPHKSVKRMNADPADIPKLLIDGKVDAVCTWKPWELPGNKYVRLGGDGIYSWNSFLIGRRATIDQMTDAVERVLAALVDAEAYAVAHRQSLGAELASTYGMETRDFDAAWNSLRVGVSLDHAMLRGLEDEGRWVAEQRGLTSMPDFLNVFYFPGLTAVRPDAVTIVHNAQEPS